MKNLRTDAAFAIAAEGVEKSFAAGATKVAVLRGVNFHARFGELVMLTGPSGCGKTTLLSALCGTLRADAGEIRLLGHALGPMSDRERTRFRGQHVGFVFQQFNLLPRLCALENVSVPLLLQGSSARAAGAHAARMLDAVGLAERALAFPRELSGGQQQRVAIARALVHEPAVLICDEPTSALDASAGRSVMELIGRVARHPQRCVLIVTHDSRIHSYADHIYRMEDGQIL